MKSLWMDKVHEKLICSDKFFNVVIYGGLVILIGLAIFLGFFMTVSDADYHKPLKIQLRIEEKVDRLEGKVDKLIKLGEKYE